MSMGQLVCGATSLSIFKFFNALIKNSIIPINFENLISILMEHMCFKCVLNNFESNQAYFYGTAHATVVILFDYETCHKANFGSFSPDMTLKMSSSFELFLVVLVFGAFSLFI